MTVACQALVNLFVSSSFNPVMQRFYSHYCNDSTRKIKDFFINFSAVFTSAWYIKDNIN